MGYLHDHITAETLIIISFALAIVGSALLKIFGGSKTGIALSVPLSIIIMTGTSFFWSIEASGEYSRFRYGFPHYQAARSYDFGLGHQMTPLKIYFEFVFLNLWFWFSFCLIAIGLVQTWKKLRQHKPLSSSNGSPS